MFTRAHHLLVVLGFAVMLVTMVVAGRRSPGPTRVAVAVYGAACWLLSAFYFASYDRVDLAQSLPIQACDLLAFFAPLSVVLRARWLKAVVYFGGFGLTTQAFFTPVIQTGPDTLRFWVFWALHSEIVLTAVYLVAVDRFRPGWRDLLSASIFWTAYALTMIAINIKTGWYYGYLGPEIPPSAEDSILRFLGPWPVRPMVMMLMGATLFVLLWLPWLFVSKRGASAVGQNASSRSDGP